MLDRLISGAGAVTDGADRSVRLLAGGSSGGFATTRPGSRRRRGASCSSSPGSLIAGRPRGHRPADPARARPGRRRRDRATSATGPTRRCTGRCSSTYVETFEDDNGNGVEDADETRHRLVLLARRSGRRRGVTVRSTRPAGGDLHVPRRAGSSSRIRRIDAGTIFATTSDEATRGRTPDRTRRRPGRRPGPTAERHRSPLDLAADAARDRHRRRRSAARGLGRYVGGLPARSGRGPRLRCERGRTCRGRRLRPRLAGTPSASSSPDPREFTTMPR